MEVGSNDDDEKGGGVGARGREGLKIKNLKNCPTRDDERQSQGAAKMVKGKENQPPQRRERKWAGAGAGVGATGKAVGRREPWTGADRTG